MMLSDVEWDVLQAKTAQGCNLLWTGDLQNPQEWVTASRAHEHAGLAHAWHAGLGYARWSRLRTLDVYFCVPSTENDAPASTSSWVLSAHALWWNISP